MAHRGRASAPCIVLPSNPPREDTIAVSFSNLERLIDNIPQMCGGAGIDCVIYGKHKEMFRHCAGYSDIENRAPVSSDALYNIYSATKIITCVAAMQLFESGQLVLTDPVHAYLPEFREMRVKLGTFSIVPAKRPIKIVDLFTMFAGLSY